MLDEGFLVKRRLAPCAGISVLIAALVTPQVSVAAENDEVDNDVPLRSGPQVAFSYPGGLSEEEYLALSEGEQLELKVGEEGASPDEVPGMIPEEQGDFSNAINEFSDPIFNLGTKYPDVFSTFVVDQSTETVEVAVAHSATADRREAFVAEVTSILSKYPYAYTLPRSEFALAPLQAVAEEIVGDFKTWQPRFGGGSYAANPDANSGIVYITSEGQPQVEWSQFVLEGVKVVVTSGDRPVVVPGSRLADPSPRYAGIRLNNSAGALNCTSGFAWRKWSNSSVYGSTAEHCYRYGGVSIYYNNGNLVGSRVYPAQNADTTLISNGPGRTYAGRVYVGLNSANTSYPIVAASSRPVGAVIAHHASVSIPGATTVAAVGQSFYCNLCGYSIYGASTTWSTHGDGSTSSDRRRLWWAMDH